MLRPTPEEVICTLWPTTEQSETFQVYAILDAARDERIHAMLVGSSAAYSSLYGSRSAIHLAEVAPYLVELDPQASFTHRMIEAGWGDSWGIFVRSQAPLERLRQHFRQFALVRNEAGRLLFFRYYDPRILRVYLPTCNETELEIMFGPINSFVVEAEDPGTVIEYSHRGGRLIRCSIRLLPDS